MPTTWRRMPRAGCPSSCSDTAERRRRARWWQELTRPSLRIIITRVLPPRLDAVLSYFKSLFHAGGDRLKRRMFDASNVVLIEPSMERTDDFKTCDDACGVTRLAPPLAGGGRRRGNRQRTNTHSRRRRKIIRRGYIVTVAVIIDVQHADGNITWR